MLKLANRAKMTTSTTGTGTITLGSAVAGYQSFADAGVANADVVRYVIEDGSNWEIGQGTYTSSGTTLSRTVLESSASDAAISLSGSATVLITAAAEDVARVQIDTYTTAGTSTWTKPSWAKFVKVIAIGGGGGGGGGGRYATSSARSGGGGGASGATVIATFPASFLGDTESVVVGAGGSGGAGGTLNDVPGSPSTGSSASTFGSYFIAAMGSGGSGGGTSDSAGGDPRGVTTSLISLPGILGGSGRTTTGITPSAQSVPQPSPGGGGGGAGAGSTTGANGGAGALLRLQSGSNVGVLYASITGGSAGTAGGNGGSGNSATFIDWVLGTGGGGGSYATAQATGNGGDGIYGSGGGGGAAADNGYTPGSGGNGGDGWVRVISWA